MYNITNKLTITEKVLPDSVMCFETSVVSFKNWLDYVL